MLKKMGLAAAALLLSTSANAAVLTLTEGTGSAQNVYVLNVQTGCTTCAVTLSVTLGSASAYIGDFLDAISWEITTPNVTPLGNAGFNATNAGTTGNWTVLNNSINNAGCAGGSGSVVCLDYNVNTIGFGALTGGQTLTFGFSSTFASALTSVTAGNIRASYNKANGQNAGIFSPGGGNFATTGGQSTGGQTSTGTVPEPGLLSLTGLAFAAAAWRMRRSA